jgi:bifunctional DNA-binding transcriptional regulator/antitoxin component of YhaV-PrlF toxin-antitoxin module
MRATRARLPIVAVLPLLLVAASGCDIVTADFKSKESAEWRKTYDLQPGGRVEIGNVNGIIEVVPSSGNTVEVVAIKTAKAGSPEAAKAALERIEITEDASPSAIKIETKLPRAQGFLQLGSVEVRYMVKMPAAADARFTTINGGIDLSGLRGHVNAETTNGGIQAREIGGAIQASTTNGGVDVELSQVAEGGVKLECTNGGIKLRLPKDAKATISASVTNGGIEADGLDLETQEATRRRLEARLNGGGPRIQIEGTNGGIRIAPR